ncbi:MAG: hypothetical protein RLZZ58_1767, partial [Pseudomonadota bacterium]
MPSAALQIIETKPDMTTNATKANASPAPPEPTRFRRMLTKARARLPDVDGKAVVAGVWPAVLGIGIFLALWAL